MRCKFLYRLIVIASIFYTTVGHAQIDLKSSTVVIPANNKLTTKKNYLDLLSTKYGWTFSYNGSQIKVEEPAKLSYQISNIQSVLEQLFPSDLIQITYLPSKKIIIQLKDPELGNHLITGYIIDKLTGESIYGAIIQEKRSKKQVVSNEKGYFVLELPASLAQLEINYIAYKSQTKNIKIDKSAHITIELENNNFLDTVYIQNPSSRVQLSDGGHIIDVFKSQDFTSIIGEKDIITNARILPGVQSGGEGQSGLYVRGGTPDQNLVLLDGVAMYETNHVAGISSIFMDESIKEGSFIRNGFPARYGGRLSSVMDIQLKEGDKNKQNIHVSAGLAGAKIHLNGPLINEKTTYTLTARTSWVNFYINNLLKKFTKYQDITINYHDILGKITHHFSPSNSLSLTFYNGSDRLALSKESYLTDDTNKDFKLNIYDRNAINWGNNIASLKWNFLMGEKLSVKLQSGVIKYNNGTRSSYVFESINPDSTKVDELDVITKSNITDVNLRADADYFLNDKHVLRTGINVLSQKFNPTVKQSTVILEGEAENIIDKDSVINANQIQLYLEDNYTIHPRLLLYGGLHFASYNQGQKTYTSLQPRFKAIWTPFTKHMVTGAFSRMNQFIHLLSNTGLGLPSDLWVPSTSIIAPQGSTQWSVNYTINFSKNIYLNVGGYDRKFSNSLEYTTPIELFYFLINDQNIVPVYNTSRDWERNVIKGRATSKGLEFLLHKTNGATKGWFSASWSKTEKIFNEINNGIAFPAQHDKTWDLNTGISRQLSAHFSIGANFVYNTGNAFSLATEEYDSFEGITLLNSTGKNNYRLPDFHQLSVNANYKITKSKFQINCNLNIYNVYNRLNAYFIYIYENTSPPYERYLKKVSILPITPSFNISITF